ncbi:unnamed protein product, partial [marine sediment metagenome]
LFGRWIPLYEEKRKQEIISDKLKTPEGREKLASSMMDGSEEK